MIKICTDAGFLTTVDFRQYFMTKDTEEFSQFTESVACREYTLPRDEKSSDSKGWIRGNTKLGPVLEVTASYLQGKYGSTMAKGGGNKKRFQYCADPSGQEILYLRALQGHSGRNPIDLSLKDNVSIPNKFFEYILSHTPGGQNLSNIQTVFFTSVDPMNKEH